MHTSVMVRVGRMGVRARGLDRACVREGGLGLWLGCGTIMNVMACGVWGCARWLSFGVRVH